MMSGVSLGEGEGEEEEEEEEEVEEEENEEEGENSAARWQIPEGLHEDTPEGSTLWGPWDRQLGSAVGQLPE